MVPVASAITPKHELALALTSGQEVKLVVSVGHVIIWLLMRRWIRMITKTGAQRGAGITIIAVRPDDHEMCHTCVTDDTGNT